VDGAALLVAEEKQLPHCLRRRQCLIHDITKRKKVVTKRGGYVRSKKKKKEKRN